MSCRHSSSMPIQSSKFDIRFILAPLQYNGFFSSVENIVILSASWGVKAGHPAQFLYLHALWRYGPSAVGRRFALDWSAHPLDGLVWGFGRGSSPGRIAHVAAGMAGGSASGQPSVLRGDRARSEADRRAQPADIRAGHRVGRPVAAPHLHDRRGASQGPGAPSQGAERAGLRVRRLPLKRFTYSAASIAARSPIASCSSTAGAFPGLPPPTINLSLAMHRVWNVNGSVTIRAMKGRWSSASGSSTIIESSPTSIPVYPASYSRHTGRGLPPRRSSGSTTPHSTLNHNDTFISAPMRRTGRNGEASKRAAHAQTPDDSLGRRGLRNCGLP